jgi:hypothetical protein
MTRSLLPYFNATIDGKGAEGFLSYSNRLTDNWMMAIFLLILYGLSIYVWSKSEWKIGGGVAWISFSFFILSWLVQIFTPINQMIIFIFFVGMIAGIIMSFIENAKT